MIIYLVLAFFTGFVLGAAVFVQLLVVERRRYESKIEDNAAAVDYSSCVADDLRQDLISWLDGSVTDANPRHFPSTYDYGNPGVMFSIDSPGAPIIVEVWHYNRKDQNKR